jgi:serine/threonine protein kinase
MTPERWQQIDKLLGQALEQEPERRAAFLDQACAGDDELRREVASLLQAHGQAGSGLSTPAFGPVNQQSGNSVQTFQTLMGQSLGHYQILSRLGEGGMGIVYKARDQHLDRFVAIKVLPPQLVADPDRKRRFVQEAKAASALNHPNIITIHDIARDNGRDFIVMEYVEGKTLGESIPRRGMKLEEALKVAIQMADALAKAHAEGIIHRDLKPGNIMLTEEGLVKILDFGLAKLVENPLQGKEESTGTVQPRTAEGMIVGTASYMSPEQAAGKPVDARSDIFSFGSILYEMVTGQRAFQGDSAMSTLAAILNQDPKPAREVARTLPYDLEKIMARCLRKDPARRFQHMADLRVALEELKEELDSGSIQAAEKRSLTNSKRVWLWQWVAPSVALLAVAGWLWFGRSAEAPPEGPLTPVPLTAYPGWELSPSFSPDGKQVAFVQAETGPYLESLDKQNVDIYIKQVGVEEPFRLTDHPAPDLSPAWSPDGQTITFARQLSPERVAYILKPQRGGPERTVAQFTGPEGATAQALFYFTSPSCSWTADSKGLVVVGMTPERMGLLFLVVLESQEKRLLTDAPAGLGDADPAISPDGRELVFSRMDSVGRGDLWHVRLSADLTPLGQPEKLTADSNLGNRHPAWVPEGNEIVYTAGTGGFSDRSLFRLPLSKAAKPVRLGVTGDAVATAISRQGNRLAYELRRQDANIWRVEISGSGATPMQATKFISTTRWEMEPRFSPNGTKIAFSSSRSGPSEIWICNRDGSQPLALTSFGNAPTNRPRWSPDGQRIVFYSDARGNRDIYVVDAEGGGLRQLTEHPSIDTNPDWSADGKWVYFQSNRGGSKRVWKVPVTGGDAVPVGDISESSPVESPDGKFLYYDKGWPDTYGIWRVPTSGGAETQFIDLVHPTGGWIVFADGIYFISRPNEKGVSYIRFKDFATGSDRVVVPIEGRVDWGLSVSPDRRTFLYSLSDESGSDLMLVENFR